MTKNDVFGAGGFHHFRGNFARVSAFCLVCAIFSAQFYEFGVQKWRNSCQVNKRCTDDNPAIGLVGFHGVVDAGCEGYAFLQVHVHLPVACYDFLSHFEIFIIGFMIMIFELLAVSPQIRCKNNKN